MNSPLLIVLGISSVLLGLYITVVSLVNPQTAVDYHIGSYLSTGSASHSFDLRSRLGQVTMRDQHNRKLDSLIKSSQLVDNDIHSKSVALAQQVNSYTKNLLIANQYQNSNMELFTRLSVARRQYEQCTLQISQTINLEDNKQLWVNYRQCFTRYEKEKSTLDQLYTDRRKLLQEIDGLMVYDPSANKDFDLEAELRKIKQQYDRQNAINDKNKQNLIVELKKLQQKNQFKSNEHDENERQYNRTKIQYEICKKNLKQFRKCEDIAKALRQYGHAETVESIQERIRSKRDILVKLRQHVLQNRQAGGDNKAITEMYAKREKELIQTIKLRLEMGYDEMKQCGCTQTQRKKLQKQYQDAKINLNKNKKQLNDLMYEIFSYEKKIKQTDKLRERLINEFREDTERLKNRETANIVTLQQKLAILKRKLESVNEQLSSYSPKLNAIEFECNQYKDRLGMRLKEGEMVSDCLARKQFYEGLRGKVRMLIKQEERGVKQGKESMKLLLQSIIHPEKLSLTRLSIDNAANQPVSQETIIQTQERYEEQQAEFSKPIDAEDNEILIEYEDEIQFDDQQVNEKMEEL